MHWLLVELSSMWWIQPTRFPGNQVARFSRQRLSISSVSYDAISGTTVRNKGDGHETCLSENYHDYNPSITTSNKGHGFDLASTEGSKTASSTIVCLTSMMVHPLPNDKSEVTCRIPGNSRVNGGLRGECLNPSAKQNTFTFGDNSVGNPHEEPPSSFRPSEQIVPLELISCNEDDVDSNCVPLQHEYFSEDHICQSYESVDNNNGGTNSVGNHRPFYVNSNEDTKISKCNYWRARNYERCEMDKTLNPDCQVKISSSPDRTDICDGSMSLQHEYFLPEVLLQPHSKYVNLPFHDQDEAQRRPTRMSDNLRCGQNLKAKAWQQHIDGSTYLYELERKEQGPNEDEFGYLILEDAKEIHHYEITDGNWVQFRIDWWTF